MTFSVIVPFLNESRYLRQCLEALLAQDFPCREYKLIFVDNGSRDESAQIVKSFPEVTYLYEPGPNVYAARNKGLAAARGEIIAFTDADCAVAPDWLTRIYRSMNSTKAAVILGQRLFPATASRRLHFCQDYENEKIRLVLENGQACFYYGYTNNMAVRADVIESVGGFREIPVPGDTEWIQRFVAKHPDQKIIYDENTRVTHLEMMNLWIWLAKNHRKGRYNTLVAKKGEYRGLPMAFKRSIWQRCMERRAAGLGDKIASLACLMTGQLFYSLGQARGYFMENDREGGENASR